MLRGLTELVFAKCWCRAGRPRRRSGHQSRPWNSLGQRDCRTRVRPLGSLRWLVLSMCPPSFTYTLAPVWASLQLEPSQPRSRPAVLSGLNWGQKRQNGSVRAFSRSRDERQEHFTSQGTPWKTPQKTQDLRSEMGRGGLGKKGGRLSPCGTAPGVGADHSQRVASAAREDSPSRVTEASADAT